ncbi:DUF4825 domain-containing protein [Aminipila butyrica]|uniref:DUF4825 domain-containing protein n=1 Tax=Aminipila butyrica TaxID=433296 RepID=A0A858BV61_9FIRM|nr:M56 family metallopeptidase [Aminipila butyrica]QIB68945.1 DUF4825 domain-containing protein [Aminipila butyrica]
MIETIITSSALILMITALRYLLRGKISLRLQYALWLLVAIRLLLPFSLFENPVSMMNAFADLTRDYPAAAEPTNFINKALLPDDSPTIPSVQNALGDSITTASRVNWESTARWIWLSGLTISGGFFAVSNIRLLRKLKHLRKKVDMPSCPLPVYMAEGLSSPCLYGISKPAIYITPKSFSDKKRTEYVIAHELTHYDQKDQIWSFVRILCLCIHWFNPFVWMAVVLSRRDSELACDERTLGRIGPENRLEYGRILIEMMTAPRKPSDIFCCATTMTGGNKEIKERIMCIAKQPKTLMFTWCIVVVVALTAVALTFGGAARKEPLSLAQNSDTTRDYAVGNSENQVLHAQDLWAAKTPYVGNNSAVGKLLRLLPLPEGFQPDHFALRTTGNERGIEWILQGDETASYERSGFNLDALIIFALIDNVEDLYITMLDTEQEETSFHYDRTWVNETVGCDVRGYGESPEKFQELLTLFARADAFAQYNIFKIGKNGEVLKDNFLADQQLALSIIEDYMVKSAPGEGVDASTLEGGYLIRQVFPEAVESRDYYAYLKKDGTAVLQSGAHGRYSILSPQLYSQLAQSVEMMTTDSWLENKYTQSAPRPSFPDLLWFAPDDQNGYCAAAYQDVSRQQMEQYLKTLNQAGWQTTRDLYKHTKLGGLYQKGRQTIRIQFYDEQEVILYFSLNQN